MSLSRIGAVLVTSLLVACGGPGSSKLGSFSPATIATADDAKHWAGMSAPNMYGAGSTPYVLAALASSSSDGGCPMLTDDGTTVHITGGCTGSDGQSWAGSVVVQRAKDSSGQIIDGGFGSYQYNSLAVTGPTTCDGGTGTSTVTFDGTMNISGAADNATFKVDLAEVGTAITSGACARPEQSAAYTYSGTFVGSDTSRTWNGSGRAGATTSGVADIATKDEVVAGATCSSEAASGTTTVTSGSTSLVITYDGATKCDPSATVKWSLNGADQGELTGVSCGAAPGGAELTGVLAGLGLLLGGTWRRRR